MKQNFNPPLHLPPTALDDEWGLEKDEWGFEKDEWGLEQEEESI